MKTSQIVQGPFGSEIVPVRSPELDAQASGPSATRGDSGGQLVTATDETFRGQPLYDAAREVREATAAEEYPTFAEALGAGIRQWDTTKLVNRLIRPTFEEDTPINAGDFLNQLDFVPTEDESEYIVDAANRGMKSAEYALNQVREIRQAQQVTGHRPGAALLAAFADPVWFAIPPAVRMGKTGRVGSAVAGAGIQGGLVAAGEGPTDTDNVIVNMLFGGALGAVAHTPGKGLSPVDPSFPADRLERSATSIADGGAPNTFTGRVVGVHGYRGERPTLQVPESVSPDLRYDGDGGVFGGAFYSAEDAYWFSGGAIRMPQFSSAALVENTFDRAIVVTPQTYANFEKVLDSLPNGTDVRNGLLGLGYDGVIIRGFTEDDLLKPEFEKYAHFLQNQIVALDPVKSAKLVEGDTVIEPILQELRDLSSRLIQALPEELQKYGDPDLAVREHARYSLNSGLDLGREIRARAASGDLEEAARVQAYDASGIEELVPQYRAVLEKLRAASATRLTPEPQVTVQDSLAENFAKLNPAKVPWARGLMWNMHKTMSNYGPVGQRVADTLFDNNLNLSVNSLESHREMILSALRPKQFEYEDMLREEIGKAGLGTFSQINPLRARQYLDEQRRIEKAVQRELYRRDQMTRLGRDIADPTVPAAITRMADALDEMHRIALKEMKAAGVEGAENLVERPGYLHRKWSPTQIDAAMRRLMDKGMNERQAREQLWSLVALSFRRANGMDEDTAREIAQAVIDRAIRKGVGEDPFVSAPGASAVMAQTRDRMRADGIPDRAIERYLEFFKASDDEAGKAGMLKRRMDLDYRAQIRVDGETISVMDLLDENLTTTIEQYVKQTSTAVAFARKGLTKRSDIEAMRRELAENLPPQSPEQLEALALFDNAVAALRGEPSGQAMNDTFRLFQTYGRSIALAWSGLWQFTEYATAMAEYGLGKTLKYAVQEIPGMRSIVRPSADEAKQLVDLLSDHSSQSLRLRPFISRFDDGYDMNTQSVAQLIGQTAGQMVPYANGMKFVHHHQARTVGNLIVDRLRLAANGDGKAREALAKYGIEAPVMDKLRAEIAAHGMAVDRWSDDVWMSVRPALGKMMDEAVLRGRLGDIPAWAAFDNVGKFLFTYRTFVLNAHNKILAGRAARDGHAGYGLIMLYQFPLAMAAVQAQSIVRGQGAMEDDELVKATISQMGAIGLFSEPFKWATGQSNSIGAVGLLPADRAIRLGQSALDGDAEKFTSNLLTVLPVVSANPIMNSISHQLKE